MDFDCTAFDELHDRSVLPEKYFARIMSPRQVLLSYMGLAAIALLMSAIYSLWHQLIEISFV
ncbi:hypothetical protein BKA56DRAFT_589808 [Ilyonectria sp. MPI-CAGE-AT-0026]|nr:hypothetical protein BKA56DRAFT_589808 [Ilyonectria sp. MPI-CAGE-AT-0026]